jgi:copper transport protein
VTASSAPAGTVRRVALRVAAGLAGIALASVAYAQPASAHAGLVTSDPSNGATLATAPRTVRLWFNEQISSRLSTARLVDHTGSDVAGTQAVAARDDARLLEVSLPALSRGTYGVLWRVLAQDDGHTTNGVVVFNIGAANGTSAVAAAGAATTGSVVDVARRWFGIAALSGLVGGLAVALLVLGRAGATAPADALSAAIGRARSRLLAFAAGCASAGVLAGGADLVAEAHATAPGRPTGDVIADVLSSTRWGHLWVLREVVLVGLVAVLIRLRADGQSQRPSTRRLAVVGGALVLARVGLEALGSHAAAIRPDRDTAVAADALHILAACLWLGALAALVLILWSPRAAGISRGDIVRSVRTRFAVLVSAGAAIVVMSGLYSAGREILSVNSLTTTAYGRAVLVKCGLLLALAGVGLVNASRLSGSGRGLSRRLVLAETLIGAVLLVAVSVLVESAPPRSPASPATATAAQARSGSVADLVVTVSASPNHPGTNGFTVAVASSRRPPPAPVDGMTLAINQSGTSQDVPLHQVEPGRYFGTGRLDGSAGGQLRAVVHRSGRAITVTLAWPAPPQATATSEPSQRLAPITNALALALLAVIGAAGVVWARRRGAVGAASSGDGPEATDDRVLERLP